MLKLESEIKNKEPHFYGIYIWDHEDVIESLSREIVPVIRDIYADYESLKDAVENEYTPDELKEFLSSHLNTLIPDMPVIKDNLDKKKERFLVNTDITRSELAEILAQYILTSKFRTFFPLPNLTKKERRDSPSRGTDGWGIEQVGDQLYLIISEAKASNENNSPPGVVGKNKDCLLNTLIPSKERNDKLMYAFHQSLNHIAEKDSIMKVLRVIGHFRKPEDSDLQIFVVPFLMREDGQCSVDDFTPFLVKENVDKFKDEIIRAIIFKVNYNLNELAHHLYRRARDVEWNG